MPSLRLTCLSGPDRAVHMTACRASAATAWTDGSSSRKRSHTRHAVRTSAQARTSSPSRQVPAQHLSADFRRYGCDPRPALAFCDLMRISSRQCGLRCSAFLRSTRPGSEPPDGAGASRRQVAQFSRWGALNTPSCGDFRGDLLRIEWMLLRRRQADVRAFRRSAYVGRLTRPEYRLFGVCMAVGGPLSFL